MNTTYKTYQIENALEMIDDQVVAMMASTNERDGYEWYGSALGMIAFARELGMITYEDAQAQQNNVTLAMYGWRQKIKNA
jgi:hypothetical protein